MRKLKIGYTIELAYMLKGTKIDHDTLDYKLHYFNLPLTFDFYPTERIKLSVGSEFSYLSRANIENR